MSEPTLQPGGEPLAIDVVSDVVCPWCYVGKRRLEQALALRSGVAVEVRFRPFQLDPTIPPGGFDRAEYMAKKFPPAQLAAAHDRLSEIGREVGIDFHFDRIKRSPNTLDAHRILRWAQPAGTQVALKEALMRLYFVEGEDIGDPALLARIAGEHGLEESRIAALLASDADKQAVQDEIATAVRIGVSGVPFFIFASKFGVSGAQDAATLADVIDRAVAEASSATA